MRVVLLRPDRIGDCVIGSCAVGDLRRALPEADLLWVVRNANAGLFSGADFPAGLCAYDEADGVDALATRLKAWRADVAVLLSPDASADRAVLAAGIPVRLGFRSEIPGALTATPGCDKQDGLKHEADYARDLLRSIPGVHIPAMLPLRPVVRPAEDGRWREMLASAARNRGLLVVHPGAHAGKSVVPEAVWMEAALRLAGRTGLIPVVIGAASATRLVREDVCDLRGRLSLEGTAGLLAEATLCLSRDSGPAHLAAAVGCPTVCVFLENTPKMGPVRWTPLGDAVRTLVPPPPRGYEKAFFELYRRRAVRSVTADAIIDAASALLASR